MSGGRELDDSGVVTESEEQLEVRTPRMFRVILHNDDYTTREFVVELLRAVFHKNTSESVKIMLHVHQSGSGVAGVYTREVAETKVHTSMQLAQKYEFPLRLSMEPESIDAD